MSAGPLLDSDGSLNLEIGVYDKKGTCHMTVPVRLGPYFDPDDPQARKDTAEEYVVSNSDCVTALETAARKARALFTGE